MTTFWIEIERKVQSKKRYTERETKRDQMPLIVLAIDILQKSSKSDEENSERFAAVSLFIKLKNEHEQQNKQN